MTKEKQNNAIDLWKKISVLYDIDAEDVVLIRTELERAQGMLDLDSVFKILKNVVWQSTERFDCETIDEHNDLIIELFEQDMSDYSKGIYNGS